MIPALFLAHGSPMLAIEENEYSEFLAKLGQQYQPKAIVISTAHWETEVTTISSSDREYSTIYDFGGFPEELYQIKYPARGSSVVADELAKRFAAHGIPFAKDTTRGLDHGSWVLLSRMYPKADIPVVQVSVNPYVSPKQQLAIGEALRGLGEEDILVIGSGVTVHNLRIIKWGQKTAEPWAVAFDDWLIDAFERKDWEALSQYETLAPQARMAVPRAEHFVPLFLAVGSGSADSKPQVIHRSYDLGTLSYLSFAF